MRRPRSSSAAYPLALSAGLLLRRRALGSDSIYRVRAASGSVVEVEVLEAPGMKPGVRIGLCSAAACALERVRAETGATAREIVPAAAR